MKKITERGAAALLSLALLGAACVLPASAEGANVPADAIEAVDTHTITFTVNGKVVGTANYTADTAKEDIQLPVYEEGRVYQTYGVAFYRYVWDDFELTGEDITVKGRFALVRYTVNYYDDVADENTAAPLYVRSYTIEDEAYDIPEVPAREDCVGSWQVRAVDTVNHVVTVCAKYVSESRDPMHSGHYLSLLKGYSVCRELDTDDFVVENGVIRLVNEAGCMELVSGIVQVGNDFFYYENGLPAYKGVVKIGEDYYYFRSNGKMVRGTTYELGRLDQTHGLVPFGTYEFDETGRMLNVKMKEGLIRDEDGELRYYENNLAVYKGIVMDDDGNYYYINSTLKAVRNSEGYFIWPVTTNGLLPAGLYKMDENGVMDTVDFVPLRVDPYVAGTKGVVYNGETGRYYFIDAKDEMVTNCIFIIYEEATNGLIPSGVYMIDSNGIIGDRMGDVPPDEKLQGAEVEASIAMFKAKALLAKGSIVGVVTDGNGTYYFVNNAKKVAKNSTIQVLDSNSNGLLENGLYDTDAAGTIIVSSHRTDDWSDKWKG